MIYFYDVDEKYIDYLKGYDSQIPNIKYNSTNKFVCGIVLKINGIDYVAPVSSNTKTLKTSMPIYGSKGRVIATIRFSFMFPAKPDVLTVKDFVQISKKDQKYANLLRTEHQYCVKNENDIHKFANKIYKIGCNKSHYLNYTCCDFTKLESVYMNYSKNT